MRVAIADDSALFRSGLAALLHASGIEVVIEAADGPGLLEQVTRELPDVAILDIRMPPTYTNEGLTTAEQLKESHPGVGVLLLSAYTETSLAARLVEIDSGGIGYLLKDRVTDVGSLIDALQRLADGQTVIDSDIVRRLVSRHRREDPLKSLTQREQDILALMAEGRSNAAIARDQGIAPRSVEAPIAEIFRKLNIQPGPDDNRRVKAVLAWLRAHQDSGG
jgi:DNA-binding NarL/FixJ family response regulator